MKDRRLKMIWNSNGVFVPSGYGVEQRDLLFRFIKDGWKIAQIAFSGLEGAMIGINGLPIYPKMADTWGTDAMYYHGRHFQADVTFSMQDVWTLNPQFLQQISKWIPYLPIDQEPIPPGVLNNLRFAYKIITFSKFGQRALLKEGFTSTMIYEGTDTNIFKPLDKNECRKMFNIPQDKFVIGMVGANKENPSRKGWQQALEAFKMFHDNHPDSVFFFATNQNTPGGFPIIQYAKYLKILPVVLCIDEYLNVFHAGSDMMAKMYNSFDILSHASLSEGFGLCVVEAQSCGLPVIVNNCDSMPELIIKGETGEICDTGLKHFTNALGYFHLPDVKSLYEQMEKLYKAGRKKMGEKARLNVLNNFNIDTLVREKWIPYFEELQTEVLGSIDKTTTKV